MFFKTWQEPCKFSFLLCSPTWLHSQLPREIHLSFTSASFFSTCVFTCFSLTECSYSLLCCRACWFLCSPLAVVLYLSWALFLLNYIYIYTYISWDICIFSEKTWKDFCPYIIKILFFSIFFLELLRELDFWLYCSSYEFMKICIQDNTVHLECRVTCENLTNQTLFPWRKIACLFPSGSFQVTNLFLDGRKLTDM